MNIQNFIDKMVLFLPNLPNERERHIKENGELLATVFIENSIMPSVIELLKRNNDKVILKNIFDYFEDVSINADEDLKNIFSITVLEILGNDKDVLEIAKEYMGVETKRNQEQADKDLGRIRIEQKKEIEKFKTRYYKFNVGDGGMRRTGPIFEYLDSNGNWVEDRNLIRKFIGGDTDFDEITEEEANRLAMNRKRRSQK